MSAYKFGLVSELKVIWYLRLKGYSVLERRLRTKLGEIDLIAKKGATLAIIEVKARKNINESEVLSSAQMKRISNAASLLIAKKPELANLNIRFDLIIVKPWKLPGHLKNAWQL